MRTAVLISLCWLEGGDCTECCRLPARRCVLPGVVEPSVAARACALIDNILGPRGETVAPGVDEGGSGQYQTSKAWPPPYSS